MKRKAVGNSDTDVDFDSDDKIDSSHNRKQLGAAVMFDILLIQVDGDNSSSAKRGRKTKKIDPINKYQSYCW